MTAEPARRPLRRAGSRWRILVHEWRGAKYPGQPEYGHSYHVGSDPRQAEDGEHVTSTTLEGTEFDELVIGAPWIHLEQMDTGQWVLDAGGVRVDIKADRDGRPVRVVVHAPEGEWPRCEYVLDW